MEKSWKMIEKSWNFYSYLHKIIVRSVIRMIRYTITADDYKQMASTFKNRSIFVADSHQSMNCRRQPTSQWTVADSPRLMVIDCW